MREERLEELKPVGFNKSRLLSKKSLAVMVSFVSLLAACGSTSAETNNKANTARSNNQYHPTITKSKNSVPANNNSASTGHTSSNRANTILCQDPKMFSDIAKILGTTASSLSCQDSDAEIEPEYPTSPNGKILAKYIISDKITVNSAGVSVEPVNMSWSEEVATSGGGYRHKIINNFVNNQPALFVDISNPNYGGLAYTFEYTVYDGNSEIDEYIFSNNRPNQTLAESIMSDVESSGVTNS